MKYRFSFTGANAMISEFIDIAKKISDGHQIDELDKKVLGREKSATHRREFRELKHRINTLTQKQIEILANGTVDEQKQITHLALCKTYRIYRDFVIEILSEKIQVFDYEITELDYNSFISQKSMDHPELDSLAPTTQKKIKQVIFRMLQQVGIIDSISNPSILNPHVEPKVREVIIEENPKLLSCFLYDESRIKALI